MVARGASAGNPRSPGSRRTPRSRSQSHLRSLRYSRPTPPWSFPAAVTTTQRRRSRIRSVIALLCSRCSASTPRHNHGGWHLETGGADIVFYDVRKVRPGPTNDAWYVLVEAGPEQAGFWREHEHWKSPLPDLIFPADHSWLFSTLWDDDWTCIGGSRGLVRRFSRPSRPATPCSRSRPIARRCDSARPHRDLTDDCFG